MKKSHYFKTKLVRLGRWSLYPADTESWHGEQTSLKYFKEIFGFNKPLLMVCALDNCSQYAYAPVRLVKNIYQYIARINRSDYKTFARIINKFYTKKDRLMNVVPTLNPKDLRQATVSELVSAYKKNREWAHKIAVYDQIGWLAEDYWNPIMENILIKKCKIAKDSPEYFSVLFSLTKPEHISSTLEEKKAVLKSTLLVANKKSSIEKESNTLTRLFGWMPVFVGTTPPWGTEHYDTELTATIKTPVNELEAEFLKLKNYSTTRNKEFKTICRKYRINKKDAQHFIDFGLALDARNEAEYMQSFCGFYLLSLYAEIARRLFLSITQVRQLYEAEIIACLQGKADPLDLLYKKGKIVAYGYNKAETTRINLVGHEAKELFTYLEKNVSNVHGHDEAKGLCASPGSVKGKVRLVLSPEFNHIVEQGDIMITETTTVDYLPAMKKAGAIITEIGSLTCHAAVVSREFGIPCIVSLKKATKNFKDGDLVEVNANAGTIKKYDF